MELKTDAESMYQNFLRVVDMVNVVISTYEQPDMGELMVAPERGTVSFGSGKDCWAFSLTSFAYIYSKKFKTGHAKMMEKLWGDNYFDVEAKKWKKDYTSDSGKPMKRAFCAFIMEPIIKLAQSIV